MTARVNPTIDDIYKPWFVVGSMHNAHSQFDRPLVEEIQYKYVTI